MMVLDSCSKLILILTQHWTTLLKQPQLVLLSGLALFAILCETTVHGQKTTGEWTRMVQVESNVYEEQLPHLVTGHWVDPLSGQIWLVGLGPCILSISEKRDLISVETRSCHHENSSASIDPFKVGYIAVCGNSDGQLIIHVTYTENDGVRGITYEYSLITGVWKNETIECKEESCPQFGRNPITHCNNDNMIISVDDLQNSWSWLPALSRWSKFPFLFAEEGNWSDVSHQIKLERATWNVPRESDNYSAIWVLFDEYFFHGTMLVCDVCTQEFSWSLVAPGNHGPSAISPDKVVTWVDENGNLWLYNANNNSNITELWLYDIHLNFWTQLSFHDAGPSISSECVTSVVANGLGNISVLIVDSSTKYMAYWKLMFSIPFNMTSYVPSNATMSVISKLDYELDQYEEITIGERNIGGKVVGSWPHTDVIGPLIFFGTSLSIFATFGILWFLYKCVHCPKSVRLLGESNVLPQYTVLDAENVIA